MDPDRIKVFHRTDDDRLVARIAHHFILDFFHASDRFFEQHLCHRARFQSRFDELLKFIPVMGDPATGSSECVRRTDDDRVADPFRKAPSRLE